MHVKTHKSALGWQHKFHYHLSPLHSAVGPRKSAAAVTGGSDIGGGGDADT